jgi:serine/threonine-protein kinase
VDEQDVETASVATEADGPAAKGGARPRVTAGERVGRYEIRGELGLGGMGVVLDGHDPDLNRRVAIKMLLAGKRGGDAAQQRLLREAQALARLSHPNVVAVFDVGKTDAGIYVAMEYVSGPTLRHWCDRERRAPADILEVYRQAGRGLAAAHHAGLVHRDFKPSNVILGEDGRVRVLDFGLARAAHLDDPDADPNNDPALESTPWPLRKLDSASRSSDRLIVPITQHGAVAGTPRYMAPEQHRGKAGPKCDVFAFCVSLYEALYASYPFGNGEDHQRRLLAGKVEEPPEVNGVPAHIQRAILSGLAATPDARPTMAELLRELERDRWRTARKVAFGVAIVAASAGAAIAFARSTKQPCDDSEARLADTWNDAARAAVHARFPDSVTHMLDDYASRWAVKHREVCIATNVEHKQSEQLMDQRMACLDVRRAQLAALAQGLADPKSSATVEDALAAGSSLLDLDGCDDVEHFGPTVALPASPKEAREVAAIRADIAPVLTQIGLGDIAAGLPKAKALAERADKTGFAPLRAQAADLVTYARLEAGDVDNIEPQLESMVVLGSQAKNDEIVATGWIELMRLRGSQEAKTKEALALKFAAEAALHRAGDPPLLMADYFNAIADIYDTAGDYPDCLAAEQHVLDIQKKTRGPRHVLVGGALINIGGTKFGMGDLDTALADFKEAQSIYEDQVGPESPRVAIALTNISQILVQKHQLTDAEPMLKRALAIKEKAFGPDHRGVGITALSLSDLYVAEKRYADALPLAERALKILTAALAPEHPHVATATTSLGQIQVRLGHWDEGCALVDKAAPVLIKTYKLEGAAQTIAYQAECETHRGHQAAALALLQPVLAAVDATKDPWPAALLRLREAQATGEKTPQGAALAKEAADLFTKSGADAP